MDILKKIKNKYFSKNVDKQYQHSLETMLSNFTNLYNNSDVSLNNNCTELEINTNQLTVFILRDLLPIIGISPYPITEQILMASAVVKFRPKYIFEWGTHLGISARIFHEISKKYCIDTIIHSIDLPDDIDHIEHPGVNRGQKVQGIINVNLHQGDGLDKSIEIAKNLDEKSNILFFLDGDHEYESVLRELEGIHNNLPNATILAHDTFYQSIDSNYNIGPYLAIQDFIKKHPNYYKVLATNLGLPGMTLLYPKK